MDLFDLIGNSSQDGALRHIDSQLDDVRADQDWSNRNLQELAAENDQLKLRLALLVRLLIDKGLITAQEYANRIASQSLET